MKDDTKKYYLGVDLHKNFSFMTVMDEKGYIQQMGKVENDKDKIDEFLKTWKDEQIESAVESCYGWYWFVDHLQSKGIKTSLANPLQMKVLGKVKTDKIDSRKLANKLRVDDLPTCYISSLDERELREILRHRLYLVRTNTERKARIKDILAKKNLKFPFTDVSGKAGRQWLKEQEYGRVFKIEIDNLLEGIETTKNQIIRIEKEGFKESKLKFQRKAELLKTIPGVGEILSLTIIAEVGDVNRFF